MPLTELRFEWRTGSAIRPFASCVSLHSHTHCSRESLSFLCRFAARGGILGSAARRGWARFAERGDPARCWWTPPLVPRSAWDLERGQIESGLGLSAMVSLSDHDSIEAPLSLGVLEDSRDTPISVEWTVPFGSTFFHLGIHNLPPRWAQQAMQAMQDYTRRPDDDLLGDLLSAFHREPRTLVVFNHPLWDENGIGAGAHRAAAEELMRRHGGRIHAFELNGLRPWRENVVVLDFARAWNKPAISGGDRHGLEPNTLLNLTRAASFSEFAGEIRRGTSRVLVTVAYRRSFFWRIAGLVLDILGDHENHGLGWKCWDERVFYLCDDGAVRSLKDLGSGRAPTPFGRLIGLGRALHGSRLQKTLAAAFAREEELAL
jgi:hypothetical protein